MRKESTRSEAIFRLEEALWSGFVSKRRGSPCVACIVGEGGARQVATLRHSNQVVKQPYGLFGVHPQKQSLSISQGGTEKRTVTRGMRLHFLLRMSDAAG